MADGATCAARIFRSGVSVSSADIVVGSITDNAHGALPPLIRSIGLLTLGSIDLAALYPVDMVRLPLMPPQGARVGFCIETPIYQPKGRF